MALDFLKPYPGEVGINGPDAPKAEQIEDLIKVLVTIRHRWGNTAIKYRINWGASALWVEHDEAQKIAKLEASLKRLKAKMRKAKEVGGDN